MWFDLPDTLIDWTPAIRHLRRKDPVLRGVIDRVGPCTLARRPDPYVALCQAIVSQQVSTAAAATIFGRFRDLFPRKHPTPARCLKLLNQDPESVRKVGLSRQKLSYLQDLAERFVARSIPVARFPQMSDEEIIDALVAIRGVGRWTAEMFLIFVMNRPNLLPVDDLGVRKGIQLFYGLDALPSKDQCLEVARKWEPYRSLATWYLWRGLSPEFKPA